MKLVDIYNLAVKKGIERDPRSRAEIRKVLEKAKKEYRGSRGVDKRTFDTERLKNPYADTRILYGDPSKDIKTIMVGIDMEVGEILAADRLNERGEEIDLVMAHHPEGIALAGLHDVMSIHVAAMKKFGIPEKVSSDLMKERMGEVGRSLSAVNHFRSVDMARLLDMAFMCIHTPADNQVTDYLQRLFDRKKPNKLRDVVALLKNIPEYREAAKRKAGPTIFIGDEKKPAGRVFVDMTGGTEGSKKVFARLSQAGVGTIVAMHLSEEHVRIAKGEYINVVIAGHIASDALGLNLILDELEKKDKLRIIPSSGFMRFKR
ncbi:MAG: NGG1p interacting factor NIF3 [Candidatus Omnitrophica bacterium]|nr:NGG1p interacting factor NIF3 [Candidatus Omnitrophota bacterium]